MARMDTPKATAMPTSSTPSSVPLIVPNFTIFSSDAPNITGTARKNVYSAATSRDAGDEREHLEHADEQRIRPAQRRDGIHARLAAAVIPLDEQEAGAIEQQHQGHDGRVIKVLVEPIVQRQADEHGRQAGNRDLQPHDDLVHAAITVAEALQAAHEAVRALLGEPRALRDALTVEGPELAPVEHHNSKDRAELDDDVEHLLERIRLLQRPDGPCC